MAEFKNACVLNCNIHKIHRTKRFIIIFLYLCAFQLTLVNVYICVLICAAHPVEQNVWATIGSFTALQKCMINISSLRLYAQPTELHIWYFVSPHMHIYIFIYKYTCAISVGPHRLIPFVLACCWVASKSCPSLENLQNSNCSLCIYT